MVAAAGGWCSPSHRQHDLLASVVGVAAGSLLRVDVRWGDEFGQSVGGEAGGPAVVVHGSVVESA